MTDIVDKILRIISSTQFVATVSGSSLTLIGVFLTLRQTQRVHERNLEFEHQKRCDQRSFDARKQAYAEAVEAITCYIQYLSGLPDSIPPKAGEINSEVTKFSVKINNLHLYATNETIEAILKLSTVLTKSYIEALKYKLPVVFILEDIKLIEEKISTYRSWIESLTAVKGQEQLISEHWKMIANLEGKKSELLLKKYQATEACRDQVMAAIPIIFAEHAPVLILIRKELGFEFDSIKYGLLIGNTTREAVRYMNDSVKYIRNEVAQKMNSP